MAYPVSQSNLRLINRQQIYEYIYDHPDCTRQEISRNTGLSLPTVTSNLTDFMESDLIFSDGLNDSSGGRKAKLYRCNPVQRCSVGVNLAGSFYEIAVCDLYGQPIHQYLSETAFRNDEEYIDMVCSTIMNQLSQAHISLETVLGVMVSVQGLVDHDGESVLYGDAINTVGMQAEVFRRHLHLPCRLINNVEAAAVGEINLHPDLINAVYFMINEYMGASVIIGRSILYDRRSFGGRIEHMCLVPDGNPCYCGKKGCIDSYCSLKSLSANLGGESMDDFFANLRQGGAKEQTIWNAYLRKLSMAIDNVRMVLETDVIIGGVLAKYLTQEDLEQLAAYINEISSFKVSSDFLSLGKGGKFSASKGASLYYINQYIHSVGMTETLSQWQAEG